MLIRIKHLPLVFVALAILGIALGLALEPWVGWRAKRPSIVLLGSGNVHPFLETKVPLNVWAQMDPLWIDEGSGDALVNAFSVFNFGNSVSVDASNRVGFVVMSSEGARALAEKFSDPETSSDRIQQNWFLNIIIARQPLAVLYRDVPADQLRVQRGYRLPEELGSIKTPPYQFVRISDLKDIIGSAQVAGFTRYFPGAQSGTRLLFESAVKGMIGWGDRMNWASGNGVREVPDYIEDLGDKSPFLELASEPQGAHSKDSTPVCERLHKLQIKAAVICTGSSELCEHAVPSDYAIVIKLEQVAGRDPYKYRVPNPSECNIVKVFAAGNVGQDCLIDLAEAEQQGHIFTLSKTKPGLPDYLTCAD